MAKIGARIRLVRAALGFPNQTAFAKALRVTQGTISDWERGETLDISLASLTAIAQLCEESDKVLAWLITGNNNPGLRKKRAGNH
jgi:transcriptional regulator with XRE-family HTH domain